MKKNLFKVLLLAAVCAFVCTGCGKEKVGYKSFMYNIPTQEVEGVDRVLSEETFYDLEWNKVKLIQFLPDETQMIYEYTKSGKITLMKLVDKAGKPIQMYVSRTYDENDVLKETVYYNQDDTVYSKVTSVPEYDENNRVKSLTDYNPDGTIYMITYYEYDEEGNLVVETETKNGETTDCYKYAYLGEPSYLSAYVHKDANGRDVYFESYLSNGSMKKNDTYTYDENGNLTAINTFFYDTVFNDAGLKTFESVTLNDAPYKATDYYYNEDNRLIKRVVYNAEGEKSEEVVVEYEDWLEKK